MEKVIIVKDYWIFKPTTKDSQYYYIRVKQYMQDDFHWFIGYKDNFGGIVNVGGGIFKTKLKKLESEFQKVLKDDSKQNNNTGQY